MGEFAFGQPVRRKEDPRLLTGRGTFIDDRRIPGEVHAVLVRSPHAHARILSIDAADARASPGFVAIFTGADLESLCKKATLLAIADYQKAQVGAAFVVSRADFDAVVNVEPGT